jgi:hypothetical protein
MSAPTSDDLLALSDHVLYECAMTEDLKDRLGSLMLAPAAAAAAGDGLTNALVESFVIHVRGLIEFLYSDTRKRKDDGIAADLVRDAAAWTAVRGKLPDDLAEVKKRADKEIAHITFSRKRLSQQAQDWGIGDVYVSITRVLAQFVPLVPEDRVIPQWHARMWKRIPGFVRGRENFYRPPIISVPTMGLPPQS